MSLLIVTAQQAAAFRLDAQHLAERLPAGALQAALADCACQNTPPGAAELSLHARMAELETDALDRALVEEKSVLQTWSLRGAPHIYPASEAALYGLGLLPANDKELTFFIKGIQPALELSGMTAAEVVEYSIQAIQQVLDGRVIAGKPNLDRELAVWIAQRLSPVQSAAWKQPSIYAKNQTLGEAMLSFALRLAALRGWICLAARQGQKAAFTRTDQWLGTPPPLGPEPDDADMAADALLRRYLHCYGPSTLNHYAAWTGTAMSQAERAWNRLSGELVEARLDGKASWLLAEDLPRLQQPAPAQGARLLPEHDPYLQMRDRSVLLPEKDLQRQLWRSAGGPGLVLFDGQPAAFWRARKQPGRSTLLAVIIEPILSIPSAARALIEAEAQRIAAFKGCAEARVEYNT